MCAIFGLGFMRGHKVKDTAMVRDIVRKLFEENQARGRHAAGLAFVNSANIHVVKKNVPGGQLIHLPEYAAAEQKYMVFSSLPHGDQKNVMAKEPPISFVGHCRWKTKGTELENVNNHPIVRDEVVGVHNGMISNDDAVFRVYKKTFDRNGRVDSEIIFALIEYFSKNPEKPIHESVQLTCRALTGGMACAFVHNRQPHIVWLFRRGNPCDLVVFRDVGMVAWSTSSTFIKKSVAGYVDVLGLGEVVELPQNKGVAIDLHRNYIFHYDVGAYREDVSTKTTTHRGA